MTGNDNGVAVVIPAYEAEQLIDEALASVAAQTRPADEVIVVDDGSTDRTVEVAERWLDRLPLRIVRLATNGGAGLARQAAIELTAQPYIANLDADDRWMPDHLETVAALACPGVIVATRCVRRRSDGTGGESERPTSIPAPERQVDEIVRANFLFSGALYPAAALRDPSIGHSTLRGAQDWQTWINLIALADHRAVLSPKATVVKISRPEAVSVARRYIDADLRVYEDLLSDDRFRPWHAQIAGHVKRRQARAQMLDAAEAAGAGDHRRARALFFQSLRTDPSFAGGRQRAASGSVALRSIVGVVSPSLFLRWRATRAEADGVISGGG